MVIIDSLPLVLLSTAITKSYSLSSTRTALQHTNCKQVNKPFAFLPIFRVFDTRPSEVSALKSGVKGEPGSFRQFRLWARLGPAVGVADGHALPHHTTRSRIPKHGPRAVTVATRRTPFLAVVRCRYGGAYHEGATPTCSILGMLSIYGNN